MSYGIPTGKAGEHYLLGFTYYYQKQYLKAAQEFGKVLELKPNYVDIRFYYASCYFYLSNFELAEKELKIILELNNNYIDAMQMLGRVYLETNRYTESIEVFEKALKLRPMFADLYWDLGRAFFSDNQINNAKQSFEKALEINPKYANVFFRLGYICWKQKNFLQARENFLKAFKLDNADPLKIALYAHSENLVDNKNKAIKLIDIALEIQPKNDSLIQWKKIITGNFFSLNRFLSFLKPKPKLVDLIYLEAHIQVGIGYANKGKLEKAICEMKYAKEMAKLPEVFFYLAAYYEEKKDFVNVEKELDEALKYYPQNKNIYLLAGEYYYNQKKINLAEKYLLHTIKLDNNLISAIYLLGCIQDEKGNKKQSAEYWRRVLELDPDHKEAEEKMKYYDWNK